MADIVIKLPDNFLKGIKIENGSLACQRILDAVYNGTILSKGHKRLIEDNFDVGPVFDKEGHRVGYKYVTQEDLNNALTIIEADTESKECECKDFEPQEDTYKYLLHGAESLVKDHPDLVRDMWKCSSCEHAEDECKDCYPELGYKNNKLKRDTEAVKKFVESDTFEKLMESLDKQDRAATEDVVQFLRDIKAKEQEE